MMAIKVPDTKVTRASVYKEAGEARYAEAEFLKDHHPTGAIYLAGYLVECYLKWALCRRRDVQYLQDLPEEGLAEILTSKQGHNLEMLSDLTGYDVHRDGDTCLNLAFKEVARWCPDIRYMKSCGGERERVKFFAAVEILRVDILAWASR
jgi:hypothetical protein